MEDSIDNVVVDGFERLLKEQHPITYARQAPTLEQASQQRLWEEFVNGGWTDNDFKELCQQSDDLLLRLGELSGYYLLTLPLASTTFLVQNLLNAIAPLADYCERFRTKPVALGVGAFKQSEQWFNYHGKDAFYMWLMPHQRKGLELSLYDGQSLQVKDSIDPSLAIAVPTAEVLFTYQIPEQEARSLFTMYQLFQLAHLVGVAQAALDLAITYAKERHQFGVAIGSFQGIKHALTDAWVALDNARYALRSATGLYNHHESYAASLGTAKRLAFAAAKNATKLSIQVHGGVGFAWEHDAHLFLKRAYQVMRQLEYTFDI